MEEVGCNLCGSTALRAVYRMPDAKFYPNEWFTVVECGDCGLGFVNPRPTPAEIGRHYPANYYDYLSPAAHQRRYARQAQYVATQVSAPSRRLLDVGCANGDFPRFMKQRDWDVEGVEVSSTTVPVTDFPIHRSDFPGAQIPPGTFDVVTAWAVLEHVHDPTAYFKRASEVLKPGGAFIFTVPNFASLASKRLFREDPPRHLYFYTEPTLRRFAEENGLTFEHCVYGPDVYEMLATNWLRYVLMYRPFGRQLRYEDLPEAPDHYFARLGIAATWPGKLRYALTHPFTVIDGLSRPLYDWWAVKTRRYAMMTCVVRKTLTAARA